MREPRNANDVHADERGTGFNVRIAVWLTQNIGTMTCAYLFAVLAIAGFPFGSASPPQYVQWTSQTFIQLVMLSILMVGQRVLSRKAELQAEEAFNATIATEHHTQEMIQHLNAQDGELLLHKTFLLTLPTMREDIRQLSTDIENLRRQIERVSNI